LETFKNAARTSARRYVQNEVAIGTPAETTVGFFTASWCLNPAPLQLSTPALASTVRLKRTSTTLANLGPFRKGRVELFSTDPILVGSVVLTTPLERSAGAMTTFILTKNAACGKRRRSDQPYTGEAAS